MKSLSPASKVLAVPSLSLGVLAPLLGGCGQAHKPQMGEVFFADLQL